MAYYRLYFLNPASGEIQRHEAFDAVDDRSAIESVQKAFRWSDLELWSGARKVWSSRRSADAREKRANSEPSS